MRRAAFGAVAGLLALPVWANGPWQVTEETPAAVVAVDMSSLQRGDGLIQFRERHTLRGGQTDPNTLRPLREVLAKRVIDCRGRRIATLSRAVFDINDALVDHQATRLRHAAWQPLKRGAAVFSLVCGRS